MSTNKLKILGFIFGDSPTVRPHIDYILSKAKKRLWMLRHLKKAKMNSSDLMRLFNVYIRPTLEYACPTFHAPNVNGWDER